MKLSHLGRYTETSMKLDDPAQKDHLARRLIFSFIYDIVKDLYSEIVFGK
jgi:hypothetical protein